MNIQLNGETRQLPTNTTVAQLIEQTGFAGRRIAVERNGEILPRATHSQQQLVDGDVLEIVQAIGGG